VAPKASQYMGSTLPEMVT